MGNDKLFQKRKIRTEEGLRRREEQKLTTLTVLIIGEGTTEYNYFNDMRRSFRGKRINIILEKPRGSAPINVVNYALDYCERNDGLDYVFCVLDRDEHPTFQEALDKLKRHKPSKSAKSKPVFKGITSVPCIEVWFIIHFTYSTKSYSRNGSKSPGDNIYDDLLREFPEYSKTMPDLFSRLKPKLDTALTNARKLSKYNRDTETTNPSTNVHELIDFIQEKLSDPSG